MLWVCFRAWVMHNLEEDEEEEMDAATGGSKTATDSKEGEEVLPLKRKGAGFGSGEVSDPPHHTLLGTHRDTRRAAAALTHQMSSRLDPDSASTD